MIPELRVERGRPEAAPLEAFRQEPRGIRCRLVWDSCDFAAWIGPSGDGWDAWCEACQEPARLAALDRGALRAGRGDFTGAAEDFARARDRLETRWNLASAIVHEELEAGSSPLDAELLQVARVSAGAPSAYWSDLTVGRLLCGYACLGGARTSNASRFRWRSRPSRRRICGGGAARGSRPARGARPDPLPDSVCPLPARYHRRRTAARAGVG